MLTQNAQDIMRAANLAKPKGLAIAVQSGGYCAVQRVTYRANGVSDVDTLAAWLDGAQACQWIEQYQRAVVTA